MAILALGINHATAPLALRERVAIAPERSAGALRELRALPGVNAAAILSTCNRTELYIDQMPEVEIDPLGWLGRTQGLPVDEIQPVAYHHRDELAVRHVFRVATGLDSLVLGEPQILGQLKQAYRQAQEERTLSGPLEQLLQRSFAVAKLVRSETRLGANPVSVAYAAVRLALQVFDEMPRRQALLIGAGETIELVARHLLGAGLKRSVVANRTLERARLLAERVGGQAIRLGEVEEALAECDILIAAAQTTTPLVDVAMLRKVAPRRRHRPLFAVDLGVPRNLDPGLAELADVYLYTVDDLREVVEEGMRGRREAADRAEAMVSLHVEGFMAWWRERQASGAIVTMRQRAERVAEQSLQRARRQLDRGQEPAQVLDQLAKSLTNRLLHRPTVGLRQAAALGDEEFVEFAARLLALDPPRE